MNADSAHCTMKAHQNYSNSTSIHPTTLASSSFRGGTFLCVRVQRCESEVDSLNFKAWWATKEETNEIPTGQEVGLERHIALGFFDENPRRSSA